MTIGRLLSVVLGVWRFAYERFAAQRVQGIGSNYTRHEIEQMEQKKKNRLGNESSNGNNVAARTSGIVPLTVMSTLVSLLGILLLYPNRDIARARYFDSKNNSDEKTFDLELNILAAIGRRGPINGVQLSSSSSRIRSFGSLLVAFLWFLALLFRCSTL